MEDALVESLAGRLELNSVEKMARMLVDLMAVHLVFWMVAPKVE